MLKKQITKKAMDLGITEVGFCRHNGKSAVCCLFPYFVRDEVSRISVYARGKDYHKVIREKLSLLMADFDPTAELFADIGPPDDILIAQKCGLGVKGKNSLLINKNLGSWFFIGYALTNLEISPDEPSLGTCSQCGKCFSACPGKALSASGFSCERCASFLTQKKGTLSAEEEKIILSSGFIFGCDICQTVCPLNHGKGECIPEFMESRVTELNADELEQMTNREFLEKYKDRAFTWRGKAPLIRNLRLFEKHSDSSKTILSQNK